MRSINNLRGNAKCAFCISGYRVSDSTTSRECIQLTSLTSVKTQRSGVVIKSYSWNHGRYVHVICKDGDACKAEKLKS